MTDTSVQHKPLKNLTREELAEMLPVPGKAYWRKQRECIRWQEALRELADAVPIYRLTDPGLRDAWTTAMTRLKEGVDAV